MSDFEPEVHPGSALSPWKQKKEKKEKQEGEPEDGEPGEEGEEGEDGEPGEDGDGEPGEGGYDPVELTPNGDGTFTDQDGDIWTLEDIKDALEDGAELKPGSGEHAGEEIQLEPDGNGNLVDKDGNIWSPEDVEEALEKGGGLGDGEPGEEGEGEGEGKGKGKGKPGTFKGDDLTADEELPEWSVNSSTCDGDDKKNTGIFLPPPLTPEDWENELEEIKGRAAQDYMARVNSGKMGTHGRSWGTWAENALGVAQVPWEEYLARALRGRLSKPGFQDYSYSKPSRRTRHLGIILPSLRAAEKDITVIIDVSGSVSKNSLIAALTESAGIARAAGRSINIITCDLTPVLYRNVTDVEGLTFAYGGATDMRAAFYMSQEEGLHPDYIVCITDAYTPWPGQYSHKPDWTHNLELPSAETIIVAVSDQVQKADSRSNSLRGTEWEPEEWLEVTIHDPALNP